MTRPAVPSGPAVSAVELGAAASAADVGEAAELGEAADKYQLGRTQYTTRLATVCQAREHTSGRLYSLYLLRTDLVGVPDAVALFRARAAAAAELRHRGVLAIHECGVEPSGRPWCAGEYVDAPNIDQYRRPPSLPFRAWPDYVLEIATQVAAAMAHVHGRGIVHGELCPTTVLIQDGRGGRPTVKILPPGPQPEWQIEDPVLRGQVTRRFLDQLEYPAPEQRMGIEASRRSDVHGFGCLLAALLINHNSGDPVTGTLRRVAEQAMSTKPTDRQHDFAEIAAQLSAIRDATS